MQRFSRFNLKAFRAWLCLTNATILSESKYLADLQVGFFGKKPQNYYMKELGDVKIVNLNRQNSDQRCDCEKTA